MAEEVKSIPAEEVQVPAAGENVEAQVPAEGANAPAEGSQAAAAEEPVKGPREIMYERIRAKSPDMEYEDGSDDYYRRAGDILDELEAKGVRYDDLSGKLMRRFQEDPEEAQTLLDYMDGMPLVAAIRKNMGDEALTMTEESEGWDEYQKAGEDRKKRFHDQEELLNEIRANSEQSDKDFEEWANELGLTDEQKEAVRAQIQGDLENLSRGRVTKEIYGRYRNALNHDADVEAAHKQGNVEGRNEKIEAERKKMAGSGLPNGSAGGNADADVQEAGGNSTADWLGGRNWKR